MNLVGKTALITGCAGTIGRAIALEVAKEGGNVIVNYRTSEEKANDVAAEIEAIGARALVVKADISNFSQVEKMVKTGLSEFGSIDILVNNATLHRDGKITRISLEDWDIVIQSCLYGAFYCSRCVLPSMLQGNWGRIINISSPAGERGYPGETAYASAKAALLGFTKSLAKEVGRHNITVNAVIPGFIPTEGTMTLPQKSIEDLMARIVLGRVGHAKEVADTILFLITKGDYVTSSVYNVDGGIIM